jgi:hypothetical protein
MSTVYDRILVILLPKLPYIHRVYRVMANPKNVPCASGIHACAVCVLFRVSLLQVLKELDSCRLCS